MKPPGEALNLELVRPKEANKMLSKTMEEWRRSAQKKGHREGLEQGLEQGRRSGYSELISQQLEGRFGKLPKEALDSIANADEEALRGIARRILTAGSLEEALSAPSASGR